MFKNHEPLNKERHRDLCFAPNQPYHFAAAEMLIPIMASEVELVAREYVIVFPMQAAGLPQALTGVDRGVNAYVLASGHWKARYVPAHVRRYPFVLVDAGSSTGTEERSYVLHMASDAPHLQSLDGGRLLDDAGQATPVLEQVFQALKSLQHDADRTQLLVQQLEDEGLLVEQGLQVKAKDGKVTALKGFRFIDTQKLAQLDAEALGRLYRSGALAIAYAQVLSLSNLRDGVLAITAKPEAGALSDDGVNFDGLDWAKLFSQS